MAKSVEQVCEFLSSRNVGEFVVFNFQENRIDGSAVLLMTDRQLSEQLGLDAVGDKLTLRKFCQENLTVPSENTTDQKNRKKNLLDLIRRGSNRLQPASSSKVGRPKQNLRTINLGLKVLTEKGKKTLAAVPVKSPLGDQNKIKLMLSVDTEYEDLLAKAKQSFFPNGSNPVIGQLSDYSGISIVNSHNVCVNEMEKKFSLENYVKEKMVSGSLRFYLLCVPGSSEKGGNLQDNEFPGDMDDLNLSTENIYPAIVSNHNSTTSYSGDESMAEFQVPNEDNSNAMVSRPIASTNDESCTLSEEAAGWGISHFPTSPSGEVGLIIAEPEPTLQGILTWWIHRTSSLCNEPQTLLVRRGSLLKSTVRTLAKNFDVTKPFKVIFSGEDGDDLGGPKREYFRELMMEIQEDILQGHEGDKFFVHDLEKLAQGRFEFAGKMVAFSILHGGPGIPVLHQQLFNLMIGRDVSRNTDINNCVFDLDNRNRLLQINMASNQDEYSKALVECEDWCLEQGLATKTKYGSITDREKLLSILIKNEIFYRVHSEIGQFIKGMNSVNNLFDALMLAPEATQGLFVNNNAKLTFSILRKLYKVNYSPNGSNHRQQENTVIYCFEAFLTDCEGGTMEVCLKDVLSFWTGAAFIPPLGFGKDLEISFVSSETLRLPCAHTCGMVLELWRGYSEPDNFAGDMVKALTWGGGFYLV